MSEMPSPCATTSSTAQRVTRRSWLRGMAIATAAKNQRHEEAAIWEGMPEDLRPKAQIEAFAEDIFLRCGLHGKRGKRRV